MRSRRQKRCFCLDSRGRFRWNGFARTIHLNYPNPSLVAGFVAFGGLLRSASLPKNWNDSRRTMRRITGNVAVICDSCREISRQRREDRRRSRLSYQGSSRQRYVTRHRVNGGRFANEGMSDRPFHACFEAKIRSISRLKIKISQTSFRVVLERRSSESRFQGDENSGFHKCFNRLSKILCRDTYLCRDEPVPRKKARQARGAAVTQQTKTPRSEALSVRFSKKVGLKKPKAASRLPWSVVPV
jgi:hypothetical protein